MQHGSTTAERGPKPSGRLLAGIMLAVCLSAGPGASSSATDAVSPAEREIDALLALSVHPGVTLERFASHFALGEGRLVEQDGFALARSLAYPPLHPDSVATQATLALRPGSDNGVAVARFSFANEGPGACIHARAFADRHGLMVAAPMHPASLAPEAAEGTTYMASVGQARVSATSRPHSHCLHELLVWHRDAD